MTANGRRRLEIDFLGFGLDWIGLGCDGRTAAEFLPVVVQSGTIRIS